MIFIYYLIFSYSLTVSINNQIFSGSSFDNILNQYGDDVSTIQSLIIIDGSFKLSSISKQYTQLSTLKIPKKSFIGDVPEYFLPNMNSLTNINIEGAKIFSRYSFQYCQSLQSVSSESCSIIGSNAFSNCKSLTSINFPILEEINPYAFENTALTKVELNTVSKIYAHNNNDDFSNIFSGCTKLTHVSLKNAVIIQGYMFYNCAQLIDIDAPKVTKIGKNAFVGCQMLNNLNFPSLKTIGKGSFSGLNIIHVNLPTVTIIQESAFESCSSLQTASFESCTILYYYAFRNCKSLTSINFPILEEIYASVFENTALVNIKLDTVFKVQTEYSNHNCRHFKGCSKLTHVSMKSVSIIGRYMFENCYQLQNINFPSCTTIDLNGFLQCKNIKIMTIGYQTVKFTEIPNPSFLTNISFPNAISIDKNALSDCKNIVYCDLPNVVNTIEPNIFSNLEKLVELRIPKVTELKENSFIGCYNLKTISLESLTKIDSNSINIFKGCMNLKIIYFPESPPKTFHKDTFKNIDCKIVIPLDSISIYDNDISVENDKENDGFWCGLRLPSQYEQFTIIIQNGKKYSGTQLSDFILASNIPESMIISLKIESGIVQIDLLIELLKKMVNLEELVISDFVTIKGDLIDGIFNDFSFSSVIIDCFIEKIPSNCFKRCINLKTVKIKNCKIVEDSAFSGCSNLECAILNVENLIGNSHFEGCISLISVSLPSLKTVDSKAKKIFYDCPLTSLYLPPQPPSTFNKETFVGKNVVLLGLTNEELMNYDINTNVEDDVANDQKWCGIDLIQIYIKVSIDDNENIIINSFSNFDTSNIKKIRINGGMIKKSIFEEITHINSLTHLFIDEASILESYIIDEELFKNLKSIQYISIMHDISLTKNCFNGFSSLISAEFKSVAQLGDSCFKDCISLEKLTIPHCIKLEGDSHFENCAKLREINLTSLKFVDNSAENIFKGCDRLERIALPSIEPCSFNKNSFKDCSNITLILPFLEDYIEYDDNCHVDGDEIGDNKWCGISFSEENISNIFYFNVNNVEYRKRRFEIPSINLISLELIKGEFDPYDLKYAISGSFSLERFVAQPLTLATILPMTFVNCVSLKEITILSNITLQLNSLNNIPSLIKISISLLKIVHTDEFKGDINLQEISIPSILTVPQNFFANFTKLNKVELTSATTLLENCFMNCISLTSIELPSVETIVGDFHFNGCTNLKSIGLQSLEKVNHDEINIFRNCTQLSELKLPNRPPTLFNKDIFTNAGVIPNIILLDETGWINYYKQCSINSSNNHYIWYGFDTNIEWKDNDIKNYSTKSLIKYIVCTFVGTLAVTSIISVVITCFIVKHKKIRTVNDDSSLSISFEH